MSWLMGCLGPDPASISRTRNLARQAPGFLYEADLPAGYLAAGGIPETCLHGDGWAVVGMGLRTDVEPCRVLGAAEWERLLSANAEPALHNLDGHFIAVRWDLVGTAGALTAYTDALGLRSLYYAAVGPAVFFATRLDVMASLAERRDLDHAAFGAHWLLFNQLSHRALVSGVERLGPDGRLHMTSGSVASVHQTPWTPPAQTPNPIAFERTLAPLVLPDDPPGRALSIGLSGGLDSRLLLAMRTSRQPVYLHSFGDAANRDAAMARRLAEALSASIDVLDTDLPDANTCATLLRTHMASTHAVSPASSVLGLQQFGTLRSMGRWMIDGGFGEVARQQYLNRLRLRGQDALNRRDPARLTDFLQLHRVDVFSEELRGLLQAGVQQEIALAVDALPPEFGIDDAIDLMSVRTRLPNFFGYEQNRLDGHILNYMPFAQPSLLRALFATPVVLRRHGRLFRELIRSNQPVLARLPLVKGRHAYPFVLPPLPAYLWTTIAGRLNRGRSPSIRTRFLDRMETVARERVRERAVREDARYAYPALLELVDGYYEGRHKRSAELDWWLALDAWWEGFEIAR